jgi:hypothetical protein
MPLAKIFLSVKNRSGDEVTIVHNKPEAGLLLKAKASY